MDTFMDKLAQRLTAQEMIKANSAAEAEELDKLKEQIKEYNDCLAQMQEVNKELKAVNHRMGQMMDETIIPQVEKLVETGVAKLSEAKVDESEINRLVDEGIAKIKELQQQNTELIEEFKQHFNEKPDDINENVHRECVKVYRNVQAVIVEENGKQTEAVNAAINGLKGKMNAILGVSIAALIVAAGSLIVQLVSLFN